MAVPESLPEMVFFATSRRAIYHLCTLLSIALLVMISYIYEMHLSSTMPRLSLILGALSLVVFPGLLFVSVARKNAYIVILLVISELGVTAIMGVLWAVAASQSTLAEFTCGPGSNLCTSLVTAAQGIQISLCVILLSYMLVLFIYSLCTHLRHGRERVWWKTVEKLIDFRFTTLTHKARGSDGRFMDGSDGRAQGNVPSEMPLVPPDVLDPEV